jgi:hypothetical protein
MVLQLEYSLTINPNPLVTALVAQLNFLRAAGRNADDSPIRLSGTGIDPHHCDSVIHRYLKAPADLGHPHRPAFDETKLPSPRYEPIGCSPPNGYSAGLPPILSEVI